MPVIVIPAMRPSLLQLNALALPVIAHLHGTSVDLLPGLLDRLEDRLVCERGLGFHDGGLVFEGDGVGLDACDDDLVSRCGMLDSSGEGVRNTRTTRARGSGCLT